MLKEDMLNELKEISRSLRLGTFNALNVDILAEHISNLVDLLIKQREEQP